MNKEHRLILPVVQMKYSYLRSTANSVIEFTGDYWWIKDINLRTCPEDDLGIYGNDACELLDNFARKFSVDMSGFEFKKYFEPEGIDLSFLLLTPAFIVSLVASILKYTMIIVLYLFSKKLSTRILQFKARSILQAAAKNLEPEGRDKLLVADLVASAACGRFVKRNAVRFELKR